MTILDWILDDIIGWRRIQSIKETAAPINKAQVEYDKIEEGGPSSTLSVGEQESTL